MSRMFWNRSDRMVAVGQERGRARLMAQQPQLDDQTWGKFTIPIGWAWARCAFEKQSFCANNDTISDMRAIFVLFFFLSPNDKEKTISLLNPAPATDASLSLSQF